MTLATETRLGRYEIRSLLGAGGMGEVYLAKDTQLERTVALKVLPESFAGDKQRMQRFIREAKTASALNHPNILTVFEIGHTEATHFIATEFIEGETLRQRMTGSRMKLSEALSITIQTADAIAAAHEAGVIHRDIKPENIMLRKRDAYVKVLDFCLAKLISLNPNYPTAHHWFAYYLMTKRQFDDAMRESKRAQELDPLSPVIGNNVAYAYLLKNDINSAIEQCQRMIELDSNFPVAHETLGSAYLKQRRDEEAISEFQKAVGLSNKSSYFLRGLGYCYAVTGKRTEALQIVKELEDRYAKHEAIGWYVASVYAGLRDEDRAFLWLEKDFQQHSALLTTMTWFFTVGDLRSDPRYADLVRRMGLTP